jgi:hypothetical protein
MRTIYAIQLMPNVGSNQGALETFGELVDRVCSWVEGKYERAWKTDMSVPRDGGTVSPVGGHDVKSVRRGLDEGELFTLDWLHPDDRDNSVTWASTCLIGRERGELQIALVIRIAANRSVLRPVRYDLGRPRIISDILESYPTTVEGWPVPVDLERLSASRVQPYVGEVLLNPARNLPAIVISPDTWDGRYSVDPGQLLRSLKGYAQLAVLEDKWAAFKLTATLGRDLTCYDGSIRVYWPGLSLTDDPFQHKLFLQSTIFSLKDRGQPLDRHLFRVLATIASYRYVEGSVIRSIRLALERADTAQVETLRQQVKAGVLAKAELEGQLLEAWEVIDSLTKESDRLRDDLEAQVRAWSEMRAYVPTQDEEGEGAERGSRPSELRSIRDAVARAQGEFGGTLVFLESATKLAEESPFQSPELVYGLFEALDALVGKWRKEGSIGSTWKEALDDRGFDYKSDISHVCKGHKFVGDYEFLYGGTKRIFGEHVTFGRGQDPQ